MSELQTMYEKYKDTPVLEDLMRLFAHGVRGGEKGHVKYANGDDCMKAFMQFIANVRATEVNDLGIHPDDIEALKIKK